MTKPFDTEELLARVRAALRNRLIADGGQTIVTAGALRIDLPITASSATAWKST